MKNAQYALVLLVLITGLSQASEPAKGPHAANEATKKASQMGGGAGDSPYQCAFTTYTSPGVGDITDPPIRIFKNKAGDPVPTDKPIEKGGVKWYVTRANNQMLVEARDANGKTVMINTVPDGLPLGVQLPDQKVIFTCKPAPETLASACDELIKQGEALTPDSSKYGVTLTMTKLDSFRPDSAQYGESMHMHTLHNLHALDLDTIMKIGAKAAKDDRYAKFLRELKNPPKLPLNTGEVVSLEHNVEFLFENKILTPEDMKQLLADKSQAAKAYVEKILSKIREAMDFEQ